ncbi:MAG: metallophosphoesterase [Elusimicrobia bacterium]|nr:metallophosphoesterase [Elusimicrobiota bacterium]
MKTYHFFPVFLLLVASYIGLHFYAARWLARGFAIAAPAAAWLRLLLLTAAFASPFIMFLKRHFHGQPFEALYAAGYAWMGIILLAAFIFAVSDLAALLIRNAAWFQPRQYAFFTLGALGLVLVWAVYGGQRTPPIKPVTVTFKDLPPELDGFRIAQISDMHVDSAWKLRQFAGIVEEINAAKPDLVLVTGDLIDPGIACREDLRDLTGKINSRLGLYGALGNHEYYYGLENAMACYKAFGIKLLKNDAADLGELRLIGLGDIHTEHLTREDVVAILNAHKDGKFTLLMSHQPVFYKDIASTGEYMGFSGHTHRGQIFPFHIFTWLFYRDFYGLYRVGTSAFYVTSGAGTWGPPLRWLAPSEIPLITLKKG